MMQKELVHRMVDELFEIRESMKAVIIPKEANQHFQKARREGLLGIQALVSHLIKEMDNHQQEQTHQEPLVKKVTIDD